MKKEIIGKKLNKILKEFGKNPTGNNRDLARRKISNMFIYREREVRKHERRIINLK